MPEKIIETIKCYANCLHKKRISVSESSEILVIPVSPTGFEPVTH